MISNLFKYFSTFVGKKNLHLKQRISQNKISSDFTSTSRILHCTYLENTKCWHTYIQTLYISSIRRGTSRVFRYLVLGKWSFYLPSNQINAISLSDVHHQSLFYFFPFLNRRRGIRKHSF